MGCYGIGINRIVAGAVEAAHDANGILWPLALAPYHVVVVPLQVQNAAVMEHALALEKALTAAGLDVLVDDRDQRPGVKFKDADLIGVPLRVVVGERGLKDGTIEIKWRNQSEAKHIPAATAAEAIIAELDGGASEARCVLPRAEPGPRGREGIMSTHRPPPAPALRASGGDDPRLVRRPVCDPGRRLREAQSAKWPPDRPVEWVAITLVFGLVIALFVACVSLGWWYRPAVGRPEKPKTGDFTRNDQITLCICE